MEQVIENQGKSDSEILKITQENPFTERQALGFLEKTSHLGLLKKYSLAHRAILEKLISHHRWNTSLIGPGQDRCYPSVESAALAIKGSPNRARALIKELEEACLIRRIERWNDIGRQTTNLYSLTPVLHYDYLIHLIHLQASIPPTEETEQILASLQAARAEAIATEQALHQSQPKPSSILGLKGAAKTRIQAITKLIANGETISKNGDDLHALLAHWERVYAEHSRHAEAVRTAKKGAKNPAAPTEPEATAPTEPEATAPTGAQAEQIAAIAALPPEATDTHAISGVRPPDSVGSGHQIQWGQATIFGGQTSHYIPLALTPTVLTTHSTRAYTYAYKGNSPAIEQGVSEVFKQLIAMDVFDRFASALGQPQETEKAQQQLAKTIAEIGQSNPALTQNALALVAKSLELIETVPPLQEKPEYGGVHSLGRLLHLDSLEPLAANRRRDALKFVAERCKASFNGLVNRGNAMVELAVRFDWDPILTFNWLSAQPATDDEKQVILAYAAELKKFQGTSIEAINEKNWETSASQAEKIEFTDANEPDNCPEKTSRLARKESLNQDPVEKGATKQDQPQSNSNPSQKATDIDLNQPIDLDTRAKNAARLAGKNPLESANLYQEYDSLPNLQTKVQYVQTLESFTQFAKAG